MCLTPTEYICQLLDGTTYYGPCSKLIRKGLFNNLNWHLDPDVFQNEDLLLLIQLANKTSRDICIANEFIHYNCISREGSTSSRLMPYSGWKKLIEYIENTCDINGSANNDIKRSFVNYSIRCMKISCINKRIMIPNDDLQHRIKEYACKTEIYDYNKAALACLKSRLHLYMSVYLRRLKSFYLILEYG